MARQQVTRRSLAKTALAKAQDRSPLHQPGRGGAGQHPDRRLRDPPGGLPPARRHRDTAR